MDVFFWAIDPRVAFWTRFEANFRLGGNQGPLFLNGLASPRVPGQLPIFRLQSAFRLRKTATGKTMRIGLVAPVLSPLAKRLQQHLTALTGGPVDWFDANLPEGTRVSLGE